MKPRLLEYLECPSCTGEIGLLTVCESDRGEVMEGELACAGCESRFPVTRGVPRFVDASSKENGKALTAERFGWQWQRFDHHEDTYPEQFLGWIAPVEPEFFHQKLVLEGGCGKGRHTKLAARWGAREVVGLDLSSSVDTAFEAVRGIENAHIIQADIYSLPVRPVFDYAFSVGVLHHLPDPRAGFISLASRVRDGGHLSAWVYGAEGNAWIRHWVDPLRSKFTSRLDNRALLQLSKIPAAALYAATRLIYGPLNRSARGTALARNLFYNEYLKSISGFSWREQQTIVFDQLSAPTVHYIRRSEFREWWKEIGASDATIGWHNRNSWRGWGRISGQGLKPRVLNTTG